MVCQCSSNVIRSGINDLIALLSPEKFTFWGIPSVTDDFTGEFDTINGRQTLTFYLMYLRHRNDNSRLEIGPCSKLIRKSQSRSCNAIITTRKYRAKLSRISSELNIIMDICRVCNWWPPFRLIRLTLLPNSWESMVLVLKILSNSNSQREAAMNSAETNKA